MQMSGTMAITLKMTAFWAQKSYRRHVRFLRDGAIAGKYTGVAGNHLKAVAMQPFSRENMPTASVVMAPNTLHRN